VAALLALLLAGAYAAPSASAAGLRAAKCCADHCAKPRSPAAARECCPLLGASDDVGAFAVTAKAAVDAGPSVAAIVAVPVSFQRGAPQPASPVGASSRAAPVFLRTLSLRL